MLTIFSPSIINQSFIIGDGVMQVKVIWQKKQIKGKKVYQSGHCIPFINDRAENLVIGNKPRS